MSFLLIYVHCMNGMIYVAMKDMDNSKPYDVDYMY